MATKLVHDIDPKDVPSDVPPRPGTVPFLSAKRRVALVLVPLLIIGVAWGVVPFALFRVAGPVGPGAPSAAESKPPSGPALYALHCASCHGAKGDGTGPLSPYLWPKPRDFGEGLYRLKTTVSGQPTDDDLMTVVHRGIPGSAMPGFPELSEDERRALVTHVRELTATGIYARLRRKVEQDGSVDASELAEAAHNLSQVGPSIPIPDQFPEPTPESLANGRRLYLAGCAQCHGQAGRGDGPQVAELKNADGSPTRPRDLTIGAFKGGGDHAQLYARIMIGMPGTPMPASAQLKPEEVGDVINYVRSLVGTKPPAANSVATTTSTSGR